MTQKVTYEYVENISSSNARSTVNPGSSSVNLPRSIFLSHNVPCSLPPCDAFLVVLSDVPCLNWPQSSYGKMWHVSVFFCWGLISYSHLSIYLFIYLFIYFLSIINFISFCFFFIQLYLSFSLLFYNFFISFFSSDSGVGNKFRFTWSVRQPQSINLSDTAGAQQMQMQVPDNYKCEALIHQDPRGQNKVAMVMAGVIIFGYYLCISCWFL